MRLGIRPIGLGVLCLTAGWGCGPAQGDNLPRQGISGAVTLDGAPLEKGQIIFSPIPGPAGAATQAGGAIVAGDYRIERAMGPIPGRYNVMITSASAAEGDPDDPARTVRPTPERIPDRYNARTSLQVEVEDGGSNTFDFALTAK